jgi:hypothetical protein
MDQIRKVKSICGWMGIKNEKLSPRSGSVHAVIFKID